MRNGGTSLLDSDRDHGTEHFLTRNFIQKKNKPNKALIPLPPTGFVPLLNANVEIVVLGLQPRPAGGFRGRKTFTQNATFSKKVSFGCNAHLTHSNGEDC